MSIQEETSDMVKNIRLKMSDVLKEADEYVELIDKRFQARENELTEQMKKFEVLKEKEKKLEEYRIELENKEKEIEVQKRANRDKQIALENKEKELVAKLGRVKDILS